MIQDHLKNSFELLWEGEALVEFVSAVKEDYHLPQKKYYIETLQAIKIMVLKALHEEYFGHDL